MIEQRFKETVSTGIVTDTVTCKKYDCEYRINDELLELINKIAEENKELKQLINTMLVQMEIENIGSKNVRYWAGIVFTFEEFQKMREIWKGD